MTELHWRCGRPLGSCPDWCSDGTPDDCTHCGGNPCRWWCLGPEWTQAKWSAGAMRDARGRFARAA